MKTIGDMILEEARAALPAQIDAWHLAFSGRAIVPTPPKVPGPPSYMTWLEDLEGLQSARFNLEVNPPLAAKTDWQVIVRGVSLRTGEPDGSVLADYRARTKGHAVAMALASALGNALALVNRELCDFCSEPADGRTKDKKLTCFYCASSRASRGIV